MYVHFNVAKSHKHTSRTPIQFQIIKPSSTGTPQGNFLEKCAFMYISMQPRVTNTDISDHQGVDCYRFPFNTLRYPYLPDRLIALLVVCTTSPDHSPDTTPSSTSNSPADISELGQNPHFFPIKCVGCSACKMRTNLR